LEYQNIQYWESMKTKHEILLCSDWKCEGENDLNLRYITFPFHRPFSSIKPPHIFSMGSVS